MPLDCTLQNTSFVSLFKYSLGDCYDWCREFAVVKFDLFQKRILHYSIHCFKTVNKSIICDT